MPPFVVEPPVDQCNLGIPGNLRDRYASPRALQAAHLEQVCEIAGEVERQRDIDLAVGVVLQSKPMINRTSPDKQRANDMQHILRQDEIAIEVNIRVGQVDGQDGIVVADIRAQQQQLHSVQQHLEARKVAGVLKEDAVRSARRRSDVGMTIQHRETVAVFERAARTGGGPGRRDVERCLRKFFEQRGSGLLLKQG